MSVTSGTVEGFSVVLWPGVCHVSKGYYHAKLDELRHTGCLTNASGTEAVVVSEHQINIIKQWAKAHGYSQERRRGRTQISFTEAGTFTEAAWRQLGEQRALPLEVPAPKARRRARSEGSR